MKRRPIRESCPACGGKGTNLKVTCQMCRGDCWVYTTRPCKITLRWHGRGAPEIGMFFGRCVTGRTMYRILALERRPATGKGRYNYALTCQRTKFEDVPKGAPCFVFHWDRREKKRRRRRA